MTFYQWNKNGQTGSWNDPSNWTPTGIPGSSDGAEIGDTFFGSSQTVTGTGTAATLETAGNTTLAGTFAVSGNLIVDIGLYQPTLTVQFGLLTVDGGPLTIGGALSPGLGLVAKNGAVVTASNLSTMDENCKIDVDASSAIEIGGSGGVAPGQLAIDRGININLTADSFEINHRSPTNARLAALTVVNNGTIASIKNDVSKILEIQAATLVNNGTIALAYGELQISPLADVNDATVSGSGQIDIGPNAIFNAYIAPGSQNTIHFVGLGNDLIMRSISLDSSKTFDPLIYGFNASDGIDFTGIAVTGTSVAYTPSAGVSTLNLLNGSQVVASIKLVGNYVNFSFVATATGNVDTHVNLVSSGPASFGPSWNLAGVADVNGDGTSDLLWQQQSSNLVEIQFASGNSTLGGGTIPNSPFDSSWSVKAVGDFNGDGRGDLVYRRASDGLTEVQLLDGRAAVGGGAIANNPFDNNWNIATAGDFNGDGKADLAWQRPSDGLVEIEMINGTNNAGGGVISNNPFDASWAVKTAGDFNGDGRADLVWQRAGDGLTEIQFLNGNSAIGGGAIANSPFDANWQVVGTGNFNLDGTADLVYRNLSGTITEVQFLAGTTPIGGGIIAMGG